jgi:hypothetical protein
VNTSHKKYIVEHAAGFLFKFNRVLVAQWGWEMNTQTHKRVNCIFNSYTIRIHAVYIQKKNVGKTAFELTDRCII